MRRTLSLLLALAMLTAMLPQAAAAEDTLSEGLLLYYNFENDAQTPTTIIDESGNGNNAAVLATTYTYRRQTRTNSITVSDGMAHFPGFIRPSSTRYLGSALKLPNAFNKAVTADFAISLWAKADSSYLYASKMTRFFDFGNLSVDSRDSIFTRYVPTSGEVYFCDRKVDASGNFASYSATYPEKPFTDTWGMLTISCKYDDNTQKYTPSLYINGVLQSGFSTLSLSRTLCDLGDLDDATNGMFIGRTVWTALDDLADENPDFCGYMDEIRVYSRALSNEEVRTLYSHHMPNEIADKEIVSAPMVNVETKINTPASLPESINVNCADLTTMSALVTWSDTSDITSAGTYVIKGVIAGSDVEAQCSVCVVAPSLIYTDEQTYYSTASETTITASQPLSFPQSVTVLWNMPISGEEREECGVTWSAEADYTQSGTYPLEANLTAYDFDFSLSIEVRGTTAVAINRVLKKGDNEVVQQLSAVNVTEATAYTYSETADEYVISNNEIYVYDAALSTLSIESVGESAKEIRLVYAYAEAQIESVYVTTFCGAAPVLPDSVTVNASAAITMAVTWESVNETLYASEGSFDVAGTVTSLNMPITAHVSVKEYLPTATTDLTAIADAYTTNTTPDTNYGTESDLRANAQVGSGAAGTTRYSFVRFDISRFENADNITSVKCRLYLDHISNVATVDYSLYALDGANDTWEESSLTYANQCLEGTLCDTISGISSNTTDTWLEFDVSDFVKANIARDTVSFYFAASTCANYFSSREGDNAPVLRVCGTDAAVPVITLFDGVEKSRILTGAFSGSSLSYTDFEERIIDNGRIYDFDAASSQTQIASVTEQSAITLSYTRTSFYNFKSEVQRTADGFAALRLTHFNATDDAKTIGIYAAKYDLRGRLTEAWYEKRTIAPFATKEGAETVKTTLSPQDGSEVSLYIFEDGTLKPVENAADTAFALTVREIPESLSLLAPTYEALVENIERAQNYWQSNNSASSSNAFWHPAAYHTGNMEAYFLLGNEDYKTYSENWASANGYSGVVNSNDPSTWTYTYSENRTGTGVLFGDWQICFQTYLDLANLNADENLSARAREVIGYQVTTDIDEYWWWADSLYMVMPVMTKMYLATGDEVYLEKLYKYFKYAKEFMYDGEGGIPTSADGYTSSAYLKSGASYADAGDYKNLFYRDSNYVYPQNSINNQKNFWARGNGWVFAALAKVLSDMPTDCVYREEFLNTYLEMASAIRDCQKVDADGNGFWTQSMLIRDYSVSTANPEGYETSGTAFFCYGFFKGIDMGLLEESEYIECALRARKYLCDVALLSNGKVGYVQPIGGEAGSAASQSTTQNFGVGAYLLAVCEAARYIHGAPATEAELVRLMQKSLAYTPHGAYSNGAFDSEALLPITVDDTLYLPCDAGERLGYSVSEDGAITDEKNGRALSEATVIDGKNYVEASLFAQTFKKHISHVGDVLVISHKANVFDDSTLRVAKLLQDAR